MTDWTYEELIDCIKESYDEFYVTCKEKRHAIARTANEYINLGDLEDLIVDVIIGELMINNKEIIPEFIEGIRCRLGDSEIRKLIVGLSDTEKEDFFNRVSYVLDAFNKL